MRRELSAAHPPLFEHTQQLRSSHGLELLREHHEDPAGSPQVGELVEVLVGGHASKRVTAVAGRYRRRLIDLVDVECHAVRPDFLGEGGLSLDRIWMNVLEELESALAVWRLQNRDLGVVAVETDGCVGHSPLTVSRPRTVRPRSVKKEIASSMSADGDAVR